MFNYTKSALTAMDKEHNFVRDTLEKVLRLADILEYIGENPVIIERLNAHPMIQWKLMEY